MTQAAPALNRSALLSSSDMPVDADDAIDAGNFQRGDVGCFLEAASLVRPIEAPSGNCSATIR